MFAAAVAMLLASPAAAAAPPCPKDYADLKDREMATLDAGSILEESVDDLSQLKPGQRALVERANTLLEGRSRIVDEKDIRIIDRARQRLSSERVWNRADNRKCRTGDIKVSLFCALQFASRDVTGEYRHRRTALEEVRFALEDATKDRQYDHRLMEFNNDRRTTLPDVWAILSTARARLAQRLALQKACRL